MSTSPNQLTLAVAAALPNPKPKQTAAVLSSLMKAAWAIRKESAKKWACNVSQILMSECVKMARRLGEFLTMKQKEVIVIRTMPTVDEIYDKATRGWNAELLSDFDLAESLMYQRVAKSFCKNLAKRNSKVHVKLLHATHAILEAKMLKEFEKRKLAEKYDFDIQIEGVV